ncbi:alpha/beta hydrolase [Bacillus sp. FJAT-42376]|uniref:alpha/beta hydrolase n=1 Tax=Bacillus sp. FJAT-42376 TaxID=2014076 RepID=UPI000F4DCEDE|nr:alpha/beta hydrolase [Bacillus sp. FJAT-42376]AZB44185.1 alpha/beta hydrolase [Bacillus sp. FJAT-42376]
MKKWFRILIVVLVSLILLMAGFFFIWSQFTYKPSKELSVLTEKDAYKEKDGTLFFDPERSSGAGVILYPGAKVEPEAYAYIGQELAERGVTTAIPKMPFHFAIFGTGKADRIISERPEVQQWYIGGHSLGGVAAANYAKKNEKKLAGLFFLGSYPAESASFRQSKLDVLSIYSTNDGLTTLTDVENSKKYLPDDALFYEIQGGNHAQFGMYGKQKGDNPAEIPAKQQQDQIVDQIVKWIEKGRLGHN